LLNNLKNNKTQKLNFDLNIKCKQMMKRKNIYYGKIKNDMFNKIVNISKMDCLFLPFTYENYVPEEKVKIEIQELLKFFLIISHIDI
jgi:hypothetical protein